MKSVKSMKILVLITKTRKRKTVIVNNHEKMFKFCSKIIKKKIK